jgi:hypothetical protein
MSRDDNTARYNNVPRVRARHKCNPKILPLVCGGGRCVTFGTKTKAAPIADAKPAPVVTANATANCCCVMEEESTSDIFCWKKLFVNYELKIPSVESEALFRCTILVAHVLLRRACWLASRLLELLTWHECERRNFGDLEIVITHSHSKFSELPDLGLGHCTVIPHYFRPSLFHVTKCQSFAMKLPTDVHHAHSTQTAAANYDGGKNAVLSLTDTVALGHIDMHVNCVFP